MIYTLSQPLEIKAGDVVYHIKPLVLSKDGSRSYTLVLPAFDSADGLKPKDLGRMRRFGDALRESLSAYADGLTHVDLRRVRLTAETTLEADGRQLTVSVRLLLLASGSPIRRRVIFTAWEDGVLVRHSVADG